jgi:DNA-binding transcriptional LysR family regulator
MNVSLSDVRYFTIAAANANLTKAAQCLGISQPSLSLAMRRLERELGTRLLVRSRSGVRLTKAGQIFLTKAKDLMARWEDLAVASRERDEEPVAKYFIGCHASLALYTLPRFLPGLMEEHPALEVELIHGASREITEAVIDFRLDFGIVADPRPHPDLVIRNLGTEEVCFAVGERWKGAYRGPKLREALLICDESIYQTAALLRELSDQKISFRRHLHTARLDIVAALVNAGMGVGILPLHASGSFKTNGFVPLQGFPRMRNAVCLIYRKEAQGSPASRKIARFIEQKTKWGSVS